MKAQMFGDLYFSFLLSGKADDFRRASEAFTEALERGEDLELLQDQMDKSHDTAELLCLATEAVNPVGVD